MVEIEYAGYNFTQNKNTDRYRIRNSVGVVVEHGWEKPNMDMADAVRLIERYILVSETVKAVMG